MAVVRKLSNWLERPRRAGRASYQQVITARRLRHITGVDVVNETARVNDGRINQCRAAVNLAFVLKHQSHLVGVGATEEATAWRSFRHAVC